VFAEGIWWATGFSVDVFGLCAAGGYGVEDWELVLKGEVDIELVV
jgi:hypothetical protein